MTDISPPKPETKEAKLVEALSGKGQSIKQLSSLLEWQPHTIRAAFTRLRQRGYLIERLPKGGTTPARFKLKNQSQ